MQWIALYYLGIQEHTNQKELSSRMNIKESTVARLVDRLERDGLVVRQRSEEDRRVYNLLLTKKGNEYRKELLPEGEKFNEIVSSNITEKEMQTFMTVLDKMINNIRYYRIKKESEK
ncbi:DNA-binding transcriptional regulator, MarR family [Maledivibacter halophilus]|uniref:DNA-binding transcriptional regulator, MarR family n=1 Tax=Maledivibacter halophilus TaxID=36842 RepID=A0A1T5IV51_9FIRM|nr:MarR family transcriptional regulator [Maledivibacter halophilus]SKC42981.1 DNA-binding transcriptional regulator, MarR family [Maledivibacter halophilus]